MGEGKCSDTLCESYDAAEPSNCAIWECIEDCIKLSSRELKRKFGVDEIPEDRRAFNEVLCSVCGEPYGRHSSTTCPAEYLVQPVSAEQPTEVGLGEQPPSIGIPDTTEQEHYTACAIQPIEFIVANKMDFLEGNVIKYVARYKNKNGLEDLAKARHYLNMLIEREEAAGNEKR
jgi:hypothetical protein